MIDLSPYIGDIATRLLGTPNAKLSSSTQLRFGTNGSIAVEIGGAKVGTWYDHEHEHGGGPWELLSEHGYYDGAAVAWLKSEIGVDVEKLRAKPKGRKPFNIVAVYRYDDENRSPLFEVCRLDPKDFRQRRPDGGWTVKGIRQVPYRLQGLIAAKGGRVLVMEGEKDCDLATSLGLVATTNPGGIGKWRAEYARYFKTDDVVIIADNDKGGRDHARHVAASLAPVAGQVRILDLPVPEKGDFTDWFYAAGRTSQEFEALVAEARPWVAQPESEQATGAAEEIHIVDPGAPYKIAKLFRRMSFSISGTPTLYHQHDGFYSWNGTAYPELGETELRAKLYAFLNRCVVRNSKGALEPYKPNMARVANVLDGLRAASNLSGSISAPAWLDQVVDLAPEDIIGCANGLLHLPTLDLLPHSPIFYTHNALAFGFERNAVEPSEWPRFLSQLWPDDPQSIAGLQEIFGYCLTNDTRQQKAFLIVGPKRSGKGTIARVLRRLLGDDNVVAPTLAGIATNFGLEPLIDKRVGIISDARLGGKADQQIIAERLLSITGEDALTIDRKFRKAWTGRMQIRFVVLSNELPRLADASGALVSRFIVLVLKQSFYGREDQGLTDRLLLELPAILNWAIAGLARLRERGHFIQPASAAEAVQQMEDLSSPIGAFLRDRCIIGQGRAIWCSRLFEIWCEWCKAQGRDHTGDAQTFGRNLRAVVPGLKTSHIRTESGQIRRYEGLGLR
jgi:putative DNA primase/helicase